VRDALNIIQQKCHDPAQNILKTEAA